MVQVEVGMVQAGECVKAQQQALALHCALRGCSGRTVEYMR